MKSGNNKNRFAVTTDELLMDVGRANALRILYGPVRRPGLYVPGSLIPDS